MPPPEFLLPTVPAHTNTDICPFYVFTPILCGIPDYEIEIINLNDYKIWCDWPTFSRIISPYRQLKPTITVYASRTTGSLSLLSLPTPPYSNNNIRPFHTNPTHCFLNDTPPFVSLAWIPLAQMKTNLHSILSLLRNDIWHLPTESLCTAYIWKVLDFTPYPFQQPKEASHYSE